MKKINILMVTFLIFCHSSDVFAYEYVDPNNQSSVESARSDIYSLKDMYDELAGIEDEDDEIIYEDVNPDAYWWPIGSTETTTSSGKTFAIGDPEPTTITSTFGYRGAVIDSSGRQIAGNANHGAIDIANSSGVGVTNVIAAKDGVVVFPTEESNKCIQGDYKCQSGYGNYVIIEHSDGNYTLYAHMATDSITVKAGESVSRGQVIGKIGTTGNSTGPHLHFEVRLSENTYAARVDPLEYVDPDNPRPKGISSSTTLIDFINQFEGVGCSGLLSEEGDNYVACVGVDGVTTIGHGVVWEFHKEIFQKYGYDNVSSGTRIPKDVVDKIQLELLENNFGTPVRNGLAEAGIDDLKDYQIDALISRAYNCGPYSVLAGTSYSFIPAYLKYKGNYTKDEMNKYIDGIWLDSMSIPITSNGQRLLGLQRRRASEWIWFTTGEVDFLENFNAGQYVWN